MTRKSYEDRIQRLRGALQEIAAGRLGPLTSCSVARQAVDSDRALAEQYRREAEEV